MNDLQTLESYFLGTLEPEDRLIVEARFLIDTKFREKARWQKNTYQLVQAYGRKCLKKEIAKIETKLFSEKRFDQFRQKIKQIFR